MLQADFIQRVRACERRLYRVARTMLPQECDCEDAVQEALLRAWDRLDSLKQEAYFEPWLIRILVNQCKTFYRRRPPAPTELTGGHPPAGAGGHAAIGRADGPCRASCASRWSCTTSRATASPRPPESCACRRAR